MTMHPKAHNVWICGFGLQLGADEVTRRRNQLALSQFIMELITQYLSK